MQHAARSIDKVRQVAASKLRMARKVLLRLQIDIQILLRQIFRKQRPPVLADQPLKQPTDPRIVGSDPARRVFLPNPERMDIDALDRIQPSIQGDSPNRPVTALRA